jgi:hypothetical protein
VEVRAAHYGWLSSGWRRGGRGRRCQLPHGPQALTQVMHRARARIVSMATWTLECDCSPLEMLGNPQPGHSHVHGVAQGSGRQ